MADEAAELKVLLTGDVSGLETAIKKAESELKRLEKAEKSAGKTNGTAADDKNTTSKIRNTKAQNDNTQAKKQNQSATKTSQEAIERESSAISKNTTERKKNSKSADETIQKAKKTADAWKKTGNQIKDAGEGLNTITKPIQIAALGLAAGGVAAAKFAIDFQDSFAGVEKTVDGTPEQLEKIKQGIIDLTTVGIDGRNPIPQTTTELNELAAAGGQLGIQTDNILTFTETMAQMGTATNLAGEAGAQTLARFMNVANVSQEQVKNLGSSIVDLGNHYATTEAEIADMALRMGATGSVVGIGAADILGYATALSSMGVEAEAGGSAVSRIWMEIQQAVSSGGEDLVMFAELAGKSSEAFAKNWKEDASGAFQDFLKGLSESEDQIGVLSKLGFENIRDIQALQRLAGEQGFGLLTSAIMRANTAWMENTALQEEFDKKAETTASQIQITKNNLVESARSIGETFLPSIVNASNGIKELAQGIAKMDDSQKQTLITTGKWIIGIGALSKGASGLIQGAGNTLEALGKLKSVAAAGGSLGKIATGLTSVTAVAPYAAAGIAAVGAAVYIGKKSYDAWYNSQYRWSLGLSDGNDEIRKNVESLRALTAAQQDIETQRIIIENPESSQEQVEQAKSKIQEIAKLLEEEYDLKISTDGGIEKLEETVAQLKEISKNELKIKLNTQSDKLEALQGKLAGYQRDRESIQQRFDEALSSKNQISDVLKQIGELQKGTANYDSEVRKLAKDAGLVVTPMSKTADLISELNTAYDAAGFKVEEYGKQLKDLDGANSEAIAISKEMSNWYTELIAMDSIEGDANGVAQSLERMGTLIRGANLDLHGYSIAAAQAMNGVNSLEDAWSAAANGDGEALNGIVKDYIRASSEFGASAQKTAVGAALIKNGFRTIDEAVQAGKLDVVIQQANELGQTMDGLEGRKIEITADGNISLIGETQDKLNALLAIGAVTVQVGADGDVSLVDQAGNAVTYLQGIGEVHLEVNADGNIDVLNEAGEKVAEIPKEINKNVTVKTEVDTTAVDEYSPPDKDGKAAYNVDSSAVDNWSPPTKTGIVQYKITGEGLAKGTSDFSGGLAMINDQRGVSDPRELVEVDGKGYLFEGRDVVLPLPKHAKIYPAGETKEILSSLGIPRYAGGKDNEAWQQAKKELSHRQATSIIPLSAAEMFSWIDEMRERFAGNIEVMKELDEEFVAAIRQDWDENLDNLKYALDMGEISTAEYYDQLKQYRDEHITAGSEEYKKVTLEIKQYNDEMAKSARDAADEASEAYISLRNTLGDWQDVGDSPIDAFVRVRERWREEMEAGYHTEKEFADNLSALGSDMYQQRIDASFDWLEHEKNYNAMSAEDYIAGLKRMEEYTDEYYRNGIIQFEEYIQGKIDLHNKEMDAYAEKVDSWRADADFYQRQAEVFGWGFNGTGHKSAVDFWTARLETELKYAEDPNLSTNEQNEARRMADEARMELFKAREDELDEALEKFRAEIDETTRALDDSVQELRDSWTVEDRRKDMDELAEQLSIYEGAVTKEGRDKYESLQDEYKQLEREEKVYRLEVKNNEVIERMEEEYKKMEDAKEKQLDSLKVELLEASAGQFRVLESAQEASLQAANYVSELNKSADQGLGILNTIAATLHEIAQEKARNYTYKQNNYFTSNHDAVDTMADLLRAIRWPRT